mgnify:CR=1 FL=1
MTSLSLSHQEGPWTGGDRRGGAGRVGRGWGWCARGPPEIVHSSQLKSLPGGPACWIVLGVVEGLNPWRDEDHARTRETPR